MKFSVILPLYNKAPYVTKAIQSVLSQSYTDFELVIMDDGSSDDSFATAQEAIKGCGFAHIHRQSNAGVSLARNNAVALSRGDYLCFLDADDWWEPSFLEEMSELISEYPDAGIYGTNYTIINETRHKTRVASVGVVPGFEKGFINYFQVYADGMYMPLWTGAVSLPRRVFDEMGGFKSFLKLGEDFDLWVRIALKYRVAFLNSPLSYYNQDSDPKWRAVGHLQPPNCHMLWNLDYLEEDEKTNLDLKHLIDNLRASSLFPYFLSKQFREDARKELDKVDWSRQPFKLRVLYHTPFPFLKARQSFLHIGSEIKRILVKWT